ncbi:MAG: CDP-diacylglycerol--glycerol-3-phosphate 3-phosphatidyltransferase [Clostridia bacterium]|nr:CDP-diacylglycerol--glycerol-3-phosphate 3-phosphatidyltransferase [[Bacteroides] pectinophilus]MDD5872123.1 CDP-diacylglycerol--glycerol-3-phosphate 3-phosphatidyltransferase [Clostridia bacterium]
MNLPNKLTVLRVIMIPVFLVFLLTNCAGGASKYIAAAVFVLASLTDMLDGKIARKYNLVTNFGKFMDPLADKLLVCSALIAFVELGYLPAWIVIIIISREFIISGFRLIAADKGVVIAANYWGKFKTTFQMIMTILLILQLDYPYADTVEWIFVYIALALTVISLVDYIYKNIGVMSDEK